MKARVKANDHGNNFAQMQNPRIKGFYCGYYPDNPKVDSQLELFNE